MGRIQAVRLDEVMKVFGDITAAIFYLHFYLHFLKSVDIYTE